MTPVLVDSSAWIHFFKEKHSTPGMAVRSLIESKRICINGIVIVELLSGARNKKDFAVTRDLLAEITFLETNEAIWVRAGEYRMNMKRKGFAASMPDVVIAATAICHGAELYSLDGDFQKIAEMTPLKLHKP
jgi:tRNA(fMet)-specific endonuclease VapC